MNPLRSTCMFLLSCFLVIAADAADPSSLRVLILGNSITLHAPAPNIGWTGNWGMAASEANKDFAHLLIGKLEAQTGRKVEAKIENIASFERRVAGFPSEEQVQGYLSFKPELIVIAIGENIAAWPDDAARKQFESEFIALVNRIHDPKHPEHTFLRTCFWANNAKDSMIQAVAKATNSTFVDIHELSGVEKYFARSERKFEHAGVANHPGDAGMQAIADAIFKSIAATASK